MRACWLLSILSCLRLSLAALPGEPPPDAGSGRVEVTIYPTSKWARHHLLAPGEWVIISSSRGLWMPYTFEGQRRLEFRKIGPDVFVVQPNGELRLVGVRLGQWTGRPELRSAVRMGADPLTIWAYPDGVPEIPPLPEGRYYALAVDGLTDLRPLAAHRQLRALRLTCAATVTDLSPLAALTNLESLWLSCPGASDLRPLAAMTRLKVLYVECDKAAADAAPLAGLSDLHVLDLAGAEGLTDLSPLGKLPKLRILVLRRCPHLRDLSPVAKLSELAWLGLHGCTQVSDLSPLRDLRRLAVVELAGCPRVHDLSPVAAATRLEAVALDGCTEVRDVSPLGALPHLSRIEIRDCPGVSSLWPLRGDTPRPRRLSTDGRLREQALAVDRSTAHEVVVMMDGRFVGSAPVAPERFGEAAAWPNILSRSFVPPRNLALRANHLPYPIHTYPPGTVLDFTMDGAWVFVRVNQGPQQLAGIVVTSPVGVAAAREAIANGASRLVFWCDPETVDDLPLLPPGRDFTLVLIGPRPSLEPLRRVRNLAALYAEQAADDSAALSPIAHLTGLRSLALRTTPQVDTLRNVTRLVNLTSLDLALSDRVSNLRALAGLVNLRHLRLAYAHAVDLGALAALPNLQELAIESGELWNYPSGLAKLRNLRKLSLGGRAAIANLRALEGLSSLEVLRLENCLSGLDLAPLARLGALQVLVIRSCDRVRSLEPLAALPNLRYVDLEDCKALPDVATVEQLQRRGVRVRLGAALTAELAAGSPGLSDAATPAPGAPDRP